MRNYYGIGIYGGKTPENLGTLWRTALLYDAAFIFTIGKRYKKQCTDTPDVARHVPLFSFTDYEDFRHHLPSGAPVVGIEMHPEAKPLSSYTHRPRCVYLLGAEDHGLPNKVLDHLHEMVQIETSRPISMNVAVAGSIVLHHRYTTSLGTS